jgi:hypothetical protein
MPDRHYVFYIPQPEDSTFSGVFAHVEITPELARTILARSKAFRQLKEKDGAAYSMRYWDSSVEFFSSIDTMEIDTWTDDLETEIMEKGSKTFSEKPFEDDEEPERTECDQMIVDEDGVSWKCYAKHTDIEWVTGEIPYSEIETLM